MEDIDELANGDNNDGISFFLCVWVCVRHTRALFSLFF